MAERPFVDGPPGPAADVWVAARAAAAHWGLPAPTLVRLGMNGIFTAGDVLLRAGRVTGDPAAAIELPARLAAVGVRVPQPARRDAVVSGALTVTAWEQLELVDAAPDWHAVGAMVRAVHELPVSAVPAGYPLPRGAAFPWWDFDALLADVGDDIDEPARRGLLAAAARHGGWAAGQDEVVSHGDVHPGNVAMTPAGAVLLDWDLLCRAPVGWDHAMLLRLPRWGWPDGWYDEFAAGYGRSLRDDPTALALAELRLVAATLLRVRAGRTDLAARAEATRRLAFWRGDPDAPVWQAQ
jgi:Ser/Thr protein kinase RdoA (MazF antagonist)